MTSEIECSDRYWNSASQTPRYPLKGHRLILAGKEGMVTYSDTKCVLMSLWRGQWKIDYTGIMNKYVASMGKVTVPYDCYMYHSPYKEMLNVKSHWKFQGRNSTPE